MKIDTKGAGSFELFDPDGSSMNMIVEADGSGSIKLGQTNAQYGGLVDVIAGGKYLGEQLTITGWMDAPFSLYNNNPPKPISLGGTSWINPREVPVVYVLNDDGSFRIDLGPQVQAFNDAFWKADTEGTYTINGIEVTLNYPNGRALEFVEASNGGISVVPAQTDSQRIYIEGDSFLLGYAVFALTE
jgi:hypothetical protein